MGYNLFYRGGKLNTSNLTNNQKLQQAYDMIASGDDYFFIKQGLRALNYLKKKGYDLVTSCDVWHLLDHANITANNPRSMGLVMKLASKNNILESTGDYRPSKRKQANSRPVRIWRFVS